LWKWSMDIIETTLWGYFANSNIDARKGFVSALNSSQLYELFNSHPTIDTDRGH
jgi:hypothetical protein